MVPDWSTVSRWSASLWLKAVRRVKRWTADRHAVERSLTESEKVLDECLQLVAAIKEVVATRMDGGNRLVLLRRTPAEEEALHKTLDRHEQGYQLGYQTGRVVVSAAAFGSPPALHLAMSWCNGAGPVYDATHQYLRPDGTVGASGRPDPKALVKDGTLYTC